MLQCDANNMAPATIDPEALPWQSTVQRKKQQQRDILSKVLLEVKDKALDSDGLSDAIKAAELITQGQLTCIFVVQSLIKRCQRVRSTSTNKGWQFYSRAVQIHDQVWLMYSNSDFQE